MRTQLTPALGATSRLFLVAIAAAGLLLPGCGDEGPPCGPGTRLSGDKCLALAAALDVVTGCGAGTVQQGNLCVLADAGGVDAGGETAGGSDAVANTDAVEPTDVAAQTDVASGTDTAGPTDATAETDSIADTDASVATDVAAQSDATAGSDTAAGTDAIVQPDIALPTCTPACASGQTCVDGQCVDKGSGWQCFPASKGDGATCDCNCGEVDPDCADTTLPVAGCDSGVCKPDGTCGACVPQCGGKQCGPDGCGGNCGICTDPNVSICQDGTCVATCQPQCQNKQCGDDGCGGDCGICKGSDQCDNGQCVAIDPTLSCENFCGGMAPGGCSCKKGCDQGGSCCADIALACTCLPDCEGKECGSDGCGGFCGGCNEGELCSAASVCVADLCANDPCSSHGACNSADGSCTCDAKYSGSACDACAAGLVDYPNCTANLCPTGACNSHGDCDPVSGACACTVGFTGATCNTCVSGFGTYPSCQDPCVGKVCDDNNPCTDDGCTGDGECLFVANTAPCDDGISCTTGDLCDEGECTGTAVCDLDVTALDDVDDGTCDASHCSLREALTVANSNADLSRIRIAKAGTVTLTAALPVVVAPLELAGQGTATILSGDEQFRILEATADLTLMQLALTAGSAQQGGAVLQTAGKLVATDVWFYGNEAGIAGGAISATVPVQLTRCRLADNALTAQESGTAGGAIYVEASLDVTACSFAGNSSTDRGGAIYAGLSSVTTIYDSSFTANSATTGGAVQVDGLLLAVNSTFVDNAATTAGGALAVTWDAVLLHLSVLDNLAPVGAAISSNGQFVVQNSVLRGSSSVCDSAEVPDTTGCWVTDGSCGAAQSGDLSDLSLETLPDLRTVVALAFGCQLIDLANTTVCELPAVQGKDQRGALRPAGGACDVGAFEW